MSKADILEELTRLRPDERNKIRLCLDELDQEDEFDDGELSGEEQARLAARLNAYRKNPPPVSSAARLSPVDSGKRYELICELHRSLSEWRWKLVTRWLVTLGALAMGFPWAYENVPILALFLPVLAILFTCAFRSFDLQNQESLHACFKVAWSIEQNLPTEQRFFRQVRLAKKNKHLSDSQTLANLFLATMILIGLGMIAHAIWFLADLR